MTVVRVSASGDWFQLTVDGHAGFSAKGTDIVCAAISILVQTLAYRLAHCTEGYKADLEEGHVMIEGSGARGYEAFLTVLDGLHLLADAYPDYITIEGCPII